MPDIFGRPDYSSFLYDSISGIGDALNKERDRQALQQERERNYARDLSLDAYKQGQDVLQNARADRLLTVQEQQERRIGSEPYEVGNSLYERGTLKHLLTAPANTTILRDPPRYRITESGGQEFVPGGPADPAVIAQQAKARGEGTRTRTMPQTSINKLGEAGEGVINQERFKSTFRDDFAGYKNPTLGQIALSVGKYTPFGASEDAIAFWQDYQKHKNLVRNALFGSALTGTEKGEFERADINPGMEPGVIENNLKIQQAAAMRAAKKIAGVFVAQGYAPDVIEAATGLSLEQLGITAPGAGQEQPQDADAGTDFQAAIEAEGGLDAIMAEANKEIANGADPAEVSRALLEAYDITTEF